MDQQQILFGVVSSLALVMLGLAFSAAELAGWGLSLVGLVLLAISVASWLQTRSRPALKALPAPRSYCDADNTP